MEEMDLFDGKDVIVPLVELPNNPTNMELLDYVMMTLACGLNQCKLAFKGGYLLNKILEGRSRMTHDIDFSIELKEDYERVKVVLGELGTLLVKSGVASKFIIKESLSETSSGGIDVYDTNGSKFVGVDVGLHPLGYGIKTYNIGFTEIKGFRLERMLSDKIHAIHTRKRFRRAKDIYDVFCIISAFDLDIAILRECIESRGDIDWNASPDRDDIIVQYKHAWDKLELLNPVNGGSLLKPDFNEVMQVFSILIYPIRFNVDRFSVWDHKVLNWR